LRNAEKHRRIGLFGGTFDPVHKGHIAAARLAADVLQLNRVVFVPAADPPHKNHTAAPFSHRVAMLELALAGTGDLFALSLVEAQRAAPSYTVETLIEFRKQLSGQRLFFIIGADSLLEIHLWYRYNQLFSLADFIVVSRPGTTDGQVASAIAGLSQGFFVKKPNFHWQSRDGASSLYYLTDGVLNISSSALRSELAENKCPDTLPGQVLKYIQAHHLYQSTGKDRAI